MYKQNGGGIAPLFCGPGMNMGGPPLNMPPHPHPPPPGQQQQGPIPSGGPFQQSMGMLPFLPQHLPPQQQNQQQHMGSMGMGGFGQYGGGGGGNMVPLDGGFGGPPPGVAPSQGGNYRPYPSSSFPMGGSGNGPPPPIVSAPPPPPSPLYNSGMGSNPISRGGGGGMGGMGVMGGGGVLNVDGPPGPSRKRGNPDDLMVQENINAKAQKSEVAAIMQRLDTMAAQQMQQLTQKMDSIEQRMELKMSGIEQKMDNLAATMHAACYNSQARAFNSRGQGRASDPLRPLQAESGPKVGTAPPSTGSSRQRTHYGAQFPATISEAQKLDSLHLAALSEFYNVPFPDYFAFAYFIGCA